MVLTACHLVPAWEGVPAALTPQELPRLHPAGPWGPRRAWEDQELLDIFFSFLGALTSVGDFLLRDVNKQELSLLDGCCLPGAGRWVKA